MGSTDFFLSGYVRSVAMVCCVSGSQNFAMSNIGNLSDGYRREAGVSQCGVDTCGERLRLPTKDWQRSYKAS